MQDNDSKLQELVGKNVLIRTMNVVYIGHFESIADGFIKLSGTSIIDNPKLHFQITDKPNEVFVHIDPVIDIFEWNHSLPVEAVNAR